jgi:hypothetical protein
MLICPGVVLGAERRAVGADHEATMPSSASSFLNVKACSSWL